MIIFKIGSTGDYSNRVIAGTYNVQNKQVYKEFTDGNGRLRKIPLRNAPKAVGTFDMFFKDMTEYDEFVSLIASLKANETVLCTVAVNNENRTVTSNFYIDFEPIRDRKGDWSDYMHRFTVKIEEM